MSWSPWYLLFVPIYFLIGIVYAMAATSIWNERVFLDPVGVMVILFGPAVVGLVGTGIVLVVAYVYAGFLGAIVEAFRDERDGLR